MAGTRGFDGSGLLLGLVRGGKVQIARELDQVCVILADSTKTTTSYGLDVVYRKFNNGKLTRYIMVRESISDGHNYGDST
jgi:hypothetical protein